MEIVKSVKELQCLVKSFKTAGKNVALVPTMGYLHEGHLSLISRAKELADIAVTSLFVNPTQFAPNEDYSRYPRDFEHDCLAAESKHCDILFAPSTEEMYPDSFNTEIHIKGISGKFEGSFRPIHFNGVATIVSKLFNAVTPDIAVFGQKDYQQVLVIKQLVHDMLFPVKIVVAPTVREEDGVAKSSRNIFLSREDRQIAPLIYNTLSLAKSHIEQGEKRRKIINAIMLNSLRSSNAFKIDYAASADADNFDEPEEFVPGQRVVLMIAAYLGKTRLIDNMLTSLPSAFADDGSFVEGL